MMLMFVAKGRLCIRSNIFVKIYVARNIFCKVINRILSLAATYPERNVTTEIFSISLQ